MVERLKDLYNCLECLHSKQESDRPVSNTACSKAVRLNFRHGRAFDPARNDRLNGDWLVLYENWPMLSVLVKSHSQQDLAPESLIRSRARN